MTLAEQSVDGVSGRRLTPMLRQYVEAKAKCPANAILMFRMGDFFELFFEDAKLAARELDLTLTARDKSDDPIPMAGVPHHAVASYIARLVDRGYSVALCDQVEDPRQAKGIVKREITRLITPGTIADLDALDPGAANYLACTAPLAADKERWAVALLDMLAGELLCTEAPVASLGDELRRMGVRELLVSPEYEDAAKLALGDDRVAVRATAPLAAAADAASLDADACALLQRRFGCSLIAGAAGGGNAVHRHVVWQAIAYAESTQRRILPHLMPPRAYNTTDFLVLDESTRRNLELCTTQMENRRRGSLLWHLDRCCTSMGQRLLRHWLIFPLRTLSTLQGRQDAVQAFKEQRAFREKLQKALQDVRDIERLIGRVAVGRANPKDLVALRQSLAQIPGLKTALAGHPGKLGERWAALNPLADLQATLCQALIDDPPTTTHEGGIFRRGFRDDLDALIALSTEGHGYLTDLECRERQRTGIHNLKVRYNKVFGYYLEVTNANLRQVPKDFVRKQTLVNAERFITAELKAFEEKVLTADERRKEREAELFAALVEAVTPHTEGLRAIGRLIAETDALLSLAQVADEGRYVRPTLVTEPVLVLREARHAVLERLMPGGERFVPNDMDLDALSRQLMIVTGPNMAGKSTVMRQTGLCVIMAHMGGFVPASEARIGLCDRLFTRVGAADNLGRGYSTFMVEMMETASILHDATNHSVVLLDEIGRGTSTFDGVSIAWAVAEYLHDTVRCRAMFATHYHELTELTATRPRIVNASVAVQEHAGRIVFLRRLVAGAANRSYGIEVARLAGVPSEVLQRARSILSTLEGDEEGGPVPRQNRRTASNGGQLPLFGAAPRPKPAAAAKPQPQEGPLRAALAKLDLDHMTPMQAMAALGALKTLMQPHNRS